MYETLFALVSFAVLVLGLWAESRGRQAARVEEMERDLDSVRRAIAARDALRLDPAHAAELRARFTRQ